MAKTSRSAAEQSVTLRHPPHAYIHLSLVKLPSSSNPRQHSQAITLDPITVLSYLNSALQAYLGLTGTAIPIDILKTEDQDVWIRTPFEDSSAVIASVSQWSGMRDGVGVQLRVKASGTWLGGLAASQKDGNLWTLEK